jgi:hypothetical protein
MTDICFICRRPVDGVYRRVMPIAESDGHVLGTGYGRVWFMTKAPVSLCSSCEASEIARRQGAPYDPRLSAVCICLAAVVCLGWVGKSVFHLTGSTAAGWATAVLLGGVISLWRSLSWIHKKGAKRETPQLPFQPGITTARADRPTPRLRVRNRAGGRHAGSAYGGRTSRQRLRRAGSPAGL